MKIIRAYFLSILSNFEWFRKYTGGKWYKIRESESGGFAAGTESWVQELTGYEEVLKVEAYP